MTKYKRIIKRVLINKSNSQLQIMLANGCGISQNDYVKLISFNNEKSIPDDIIKRVLLNKAVDQLYLTVPKDSGFVPGDYIEIIPIKIRNIDTSKCPIYKRSSVFMDENGNYIKKENKGDEVDE